MLQVGSGFLSQHSKEVFFGLGDAKRPGAGVDPLAKRTGAGASRSSFEPQDLGRRRICEPSNRTIQGSQRLLKKRISIVEPDKIEPLPTAVATWLLVPVAAPDFSLPDLAGGAPDTLSIRGKPVLLNFWTSTVIRLP